MGAQFLERPVYRDTHGTFTFIQGGRDGRVVRIFDKFHDNHPPVIFRQPGDGLQHPAVLRLDFRLLLRAGITVSDVVLIIQRYLFLPLPVEIYNQVPADGHQPGGEGGRLLPVAPDGFPCVNKHLLRQVFGVAGITDAVVDVPVDPVDMDIIQFTEGPSVAIAAFTASLSISFSDAICLPLCNCFSTMINGFGRGMLHLYYYTRAGAQV